MGSAVALAVLTGCGKSASHAAGTPAASGSQPTAAAAKNVPTDCRSATGAGADAAAYAASLVLGVDYREFRLLPQVVKPLVTSGFDSNLATYLDEQKKTITTSKLRQVVTSTAATYAAGSCAAPVYAVSLVRQTTTTTEGVQTSSVAVRATMVWNGSAYLLQTLAST